MTDLEQWSKRTVGVGEPRIGRDNPRGTGYPQDRKFGLDVTWTLRIYLTSNETMKLKPEEIMDKRHLVSAWSSRILMERRGWEDISQWRWKTGDGRTAAHGR